MNRVRATCLAVLTVLALGCDKKATAGPDPSASAAAVPVPTAPPPPPPETPAEHVMKLNFAGAVAFAKPYMEDTADQDSAGAVLLAAWASRNMKWADVAVATDETSYALVRKDSDAARGKRICTSGQIIQIEVHKFQSGDRPLSEGLLMSNGGNLYNYIAAGSSGSLVEQSYARFCGVVTGKYDYSNSAGGEGHAVEMVGMFDLPENKVKAAPTTGQAAGSPPVVAVEDLPRSGTPSGGAPPSMTPKIQACCNAMRGRASQLGASPEATQLMSVAAQCDVFVQHGDATGLTPMMRNVSAAQTLPACQF